MVFVRDIEDPIAVIFITVFYFSGFNFAVAAWSPTLAYRVALVAVIVALVVYCILSATGRHRAGLPFGLLLLFPVTCFVAGGI